MHGVDDGDHLGDAAKDAKKLLPFHDGDVGVEFGASEDFRELLRRRLGDQELGFVKVAPTGDSPSASSASLR
jgi:hypothetical protein